MKANKISSMKRVQWWDGKPERSKLGNKDNKTLFLYFSVKLISFKLISTFGKV